MLIKKHLENIENEGKRYVFYPESCHSVTTTVNIIAYFFYFFPMHILFHSVVVWTLLC